MGAGGPEKLRRLQAGCPGCLGRRVSGIMSCKGMHMLNFLNSYVFENVFLLPLFVKNREVKNALDTVLPPQRPVSFLGLRGV